MKKVLFIMLLLPFFSSGQVVVTYSVTGSGIVLHGSLPAVVPTFPSFPGAGSYDDVYTDTTTIGFPFTFYGVSNNYCVIGSNGSICFNLANSFTFDPWSVAAPLLGNASALNSICVPWCNRFFPEPGEIYQYTAGTAPNRIFVVLFCHNPLYGGSEYTTNTVVLHETSNLIDIFIGDYTSSAYAIEGVQNAAGTSATVVPGRNYPSRWTATHDGYRFTPISGTSYAVAPISYDSIPFPASLAVVYWYDSVTGAYLGSGDSVLVHPLTPTTYTAVSVVCDDTASAVSILVSPACSGTPVAGLVHTTTSEACPTTTVSLTDTGSTLWASHQWQSSPDSVTWTNVAGAAFTTYTFSGLLATSYYRCVAGCAVGGGSTPSAGVKVAYVTVCPCVLASAGTITASVPFACTAASVTLTDTGYDFSAASMQWQSSPDSIAWTNIVGATSPVYSFTGLTATTYYRVKIVCSSGADSMTTAAVEIIYTPTCTCSGTPDAGAAIASTTSCSSCSLTLNLSGATLAEGITYQWQQSADSVTWAAIPGATSVPYILTPYSTFYYRCNVTCTHSSLSALSSAVEVPYQYRIIADTVENIPATACTGSDFYIEANGVSPLLFVKTFYGDCTTDSEALTSGFTTAATTVAHLYKFPGTYTVKQVLYWNNIPQDSEAFSYEFFYCHTLPIKFYNDLNGNCLKDSAEPYISVPILVKVDSNGVTVDTISVVSGLYYPAYGLPGTIYSFSVLPGAYVASCSSSGILYDTIVSAVNTYPVKYYGLSCSGSAVFDLAVTDVIPVTGENDEWGNVYASNNLCTPIDATVTVYYSRQYDIDEGGGRMDASPAPSSYTDSTITWNVAGLTSSSRPVDLYYAIWRSPVGPPLTAGDIVQTYVAITPNTGDVDTSNNHCFVQDTVKAGCDPNEMSVSPAGCIATGDVTQLQYTASFVNTGNDTAFNIYVMDTLSPYVDIRSLKLLMASATMNLAMINDGVNNIIKFDFPRINLLDSAFNSQQCSGAIVFNINTFPGLAAGTAIFNHAGIFFDDNPVVMTNTVENMVGCPSIQSVKSLTSESEQVNIYPDPASASINVTAQSPITEIEISNMLGQTVYNHEYQSEQVQVDVSALPPGLYFLKVNGSEVRKFVKE